MLTIMDMLGVPAADQPAVAYAAEKLFGMSDDEYSTLEERAQDPVAQIMLLSNTGVELAKFRRNNPGDDLMTEHRQRRGRRAPADRRGDRRIPDPAGVGRQRHHQADHHARDDGAGRQPRPARLADGGLREPNRPGRRGIRALVLTGPAVRPLRDRGHRDQRATGQPPATRSACSTARRTATKRSSTSRAAFDLQRSPNPHLGFGGGGPHFCLGNQLAKAELRNLFRELLTRLKTVEFGEPDLLYSSFVHGVKRLPAFVR